MTQRKQGRRMNERDASRFYYLVDALAGEPGKAKKILRFELEEASKAGGEYREVIEALRKAIERTTTPLDLDRLQKIGQRFAKEGDTLEQAMGEALAWAVENHRRPRRQAPRPQAKAEIDPEKIDLLKLL
jgi:hypothetical protein